VWGRLAGEGKFGQGERLAKQKGKDRRKVRGALRTMEAKNGREVAAKKINQYQQEINRGLRWLHAG